MEGTLVELVDHWATAQRRRGVLESSIERRTADIRAFARYLEPRPLTDATKVDVETFMDRGVGRDGKTYAPRTRYSRISNLHCFYEWAIFEDHAEADPTIKIERPILRAGLPRPVTNEELYTALRGADSRMRLWLSLMAFAGLRCKEIAGLHRDDILEDRKLLRVLGKGDKMRLVPIHPIIAGLLDTYPLPRRGVLFPSPDGSAIPPARVSRLTALHCAEAGVNATAHNFRHWFATVAFEACGDIYTVAELCGHSNLNTAKIYAAFSPTRARAAVAGIQAPVSKHPMLPGF